MAQPERDSIDEALARFIDGEPEPGDDELLADAMGADEGFAREVAGLLMVDDLLRQAAVPDERAFLDALELRLFAAGEGDEFLGKLARRLRADGPSSWPSRVQAWVAVACAVAMLTLVFAWGKWLGGARDRAGPPEVVGRVGETPADAARRDMMAGDALAVLTRVVEARWAATDVRPEHGATLRPGHLRLSEGWVQIEFFSGASMILEGPADLELLSPERAFCHRGKLRMHVPPHAHGFTVGAPGVDAVDLGTEFALRVDERGAGEVHVLAGEVELRGTGERPATRDVRTLKAGRGACFGSGDDLREIDAAAAGFVDRARLQQLENTASQESHRRWRAYSEALRADPATIVYYSFDDHSPWERTLRNVGPRHGEALHGAIVGCSWTEGRWPGKGSLDFKRIGDRVLIDVPGRFDSVTLAAWVRIDGLDHEYCSLMLADDYDDPGEIHWQLQGGGKLNMGACGNFINISPPVIGAGDLGRWVHLVAVYDAPAKAMTHYLDGKPVSRCDLARTIPLRIGHAEIGNWSARTQRTVPIRSLNGRIDEFVILARAMPAEEVLRMYESGKPGS